MIEFRQKLFTEYDAMRQLYVELKRFGADRNIGIIDTSSLIPVLRGNNIVIEKFVQATRVFGKDRYRMYIKIGAKAKMPDDVRLPQYSYTKSLGNLNMGIEYGFKAGDIQVQNNQNQNQNPPQPRTYSDTTKFRQKDFSKNKNKNNNNNNNNGGGGGGNFIKASFKPNIDFLTYQVHKLLADAIKYDKKDRSLVLECDSIQDAIRALNILPFGIGYKIFLLNA